MDNAIEVVWGPLKTTLRELYLEQDLSLAEVMDKMITEHQFNATKSQYELQFKKWRFRKNRTAEEWKIVAHKLAERKKEHKKSEVVLNGSLINPKKLRKETLRYRPLPTEIEVFPAVPPAPTPEGFIIRTPPPDTVSVPTSTEFHYVHPPINISPVLMDCLPFCHFNFVFSHDGNPFLTIPENSGSDMILLSQDLHSIVLEELIERNGKSVPGSFSETIKAFLPENIFPSNPTAVDMAILQRRPTSVLLFLKLTIYLVSNNFFGPTSVVSKKAYKWIKRHSNACLMKYLLSIGGPTVEALAEGLFRFAIDAEDFHTVKEMMRLGINPNEQVYRDRQGNCCTALNRACKMQSLELARALINGGAKVDVSVGNDDPESVLMSATDGFDENGKPKAHMGAELVQILLAAGAVVNPGLGQSPLINAIKWGHLEIVKLLVSTGADVNILLGGVGYTITPLTEALLCQDHVPDADVIEMVRILLNAGADPHAASMLEFAMIRKSIELAQLLLESGARLTKLSFLGAVHFCDINFVKLLLKFGGQVTELVIERAVECNPTLVFFLLETADDRTKKRCETAALIKSIECRRMGLISRLGASGAQLKKTSKLKDAIRKVAEEGDMSVLSFLLDEKSRYRTPCLESLDRALQIAIMNDREEIVELLLTAGVDVNDTGQSLEDSPLSEAIKKKNLHLAKQLLVARAAVNGTQQEGSSRLGVIYITITLLPAVVGWGCYPLVEDIINAGADIDAPDRIYGRTALFTAIEKKDMKLIKLLIDAGANVNTTGALLSGATALKAASQNNDVQMVQYLLGLGADPDEWSLMAAISGSLELVKMLLAARLYRYKRYSKGYGCGALQHAIKLGNSAMIKILLAEGIDANIIIPRKLGDWAVPGCPLLRNPLDPYLISGESALGTAIEWDKSENSWIVRMLLHGGADPNSIVTYNHQTALLLAINRNNLALVKVLIAAGADANPILRSGVRRTPLQLAVEIGRIDIVSVLLDNGADVNAPPFDRYGATALQFAAINGYIGIAQLLIQRGADINAPTAKIGGRTALEGAAEHGRIDLLQLLLVAGAQIIGAGLAQYDRARELALENGHRAACRLLEKYSADMSGNFAPLDDMWTDFNVSTPWDDTWMDFNSFGEGLLP
ncbi:ankyrin repeat-containing domain protein [Tricladium varicosporioides]|nr:ankyrin repeat-containing domain protein [Hymenoscyphus varicosporioides]